MKKEFKAPKLQVKKIEAQSILAGSDNPSGVAAKPLAVGHDDKSILW